MPPLERRAAPHHESPLSTARVNPPPRPVSPRRGVRRSGTRTLRSMPSLPRQVPLAIPTPSPHRSMSTTSGCPGKAAPLGYRPRRWAVDLGHATHGGPKPGTGSGIQNRKPQPPARGRPRALPRIRRHATRLLRLPTRDAAPGPPPMSTVTRPERAKWSPRPVFRSVSGVESPGEGGAQLVAVGVAQTGRELHRVGGTG